MELVLNEITNFSPSIANQAKLHEEEMEYSIETNNLSPSDIPNEVIIERINDDTIKFSFKYLTMEEYSGLELIQEVGFSFAYSNITGRLYNTIFHISSFKNFSKKLKIYADRFNRKRNKDNLKFGSLLVKKISKEYII